MILPPHYIAIPKSGSGPGVLVLHSWWGLNPFFKSLCDRFSDTGFVALAPDLYDGKVASTVEAAKALRTQATATRREPAYKMLTAAISYLSRQEAVTTTHIAIVGFSMGGPLGALVGPKARTSHCGHGDLLCRAKRRLHTKQFALSFPLCRKR